MNEIHVRESAQRLAVEAGFVRTASGDWQAPAEGNYAGQAWYAPYYVHAALDGLGELFARTDGRVQFEVIEISRIERMVFCLGGRHTHIAVIYGGDTRRALVRVLTYLEYAALLRHLDQMVQ